MFPTVGRVASVGRARVMAGGATKKSPGGGKRGGPKRGATGPPRPKWGVNAKSSTKPAHGAPADVATVETGARLYRSYDPAALGLFKTCTRVDWTDNGEAPDVGAPSSPDGRRMTRVSAKRGALSSLGALSRAAHLNGWRVQVTGDDSACDVYWCASCSAHQLESLCAGLRERTRFPAREQVSFKTTAFVAGEPVTRVLHIPSPTKNVTRGDASSSSSSSASSSSRIPRAPSEAESTATTGDTGASLALTRLKASRATRAKAPAAHAAVPRRLRLRVAKFPGMNDACHKVLFSKLMNRAKALFPAEFAFWPDTLILPDDWLAVADAFGQLGSDNQRDPPLGVPTSIGSNKGADKRPKERRWFICKPDRGSQGAGIFLTDSPTDLERKIRAKCPKVLYKNGLGGLFGAGARVGGGDGQDMGSNAARRAVSGGAGIGGSAKPASTKPGFGSHVPGATTPGGDASTAVGYVVQRYLPKPLLLNGLKFDLRLYVLLLGTEGFPAFLSKEGLARFCTERYQAPDDSTRNKTKSFLTNYTLNKKSEGFVRSDEHDGGADGSKRSLASVMQELAVDNGADVDALWSRIERMVEGTCGAMRHALEDSAESVGVSPETCFQVLGFDVILDENLDPHLLEVNAGPSFAIDNVVPVDPREVRKGHYAPSKPANSRFMDASPVLHECASLDLVPDVCYCRDGGGAAHVHELSAVDAHVKSSALAGALEIVRRAQRGGRLGTGGGEGTHATSGAAARHGGFRGVSVSDGAGAGWWCDQPEEIRAHVAYRRRRTAASSSSDGGSWSGRPVSSGRTDGPGDTAADLDAIDSAIARESTSDSPGAFASSPSDASSPGDASPSGTLAQNPTHYPKPRLNPEEDIGWRLASLYSRAKVAFVRTLEAKKTEGGSREREQSHSKLRRALTMTGAMSSSEVDVTLMRWKGKRARAGGAFPHYMDLVYELASRLFPKAPGAAAVGSVLDMLDDAEVAAQAPA